jgi:DNA invertase Pin-like site-specific DNA recombinase
MTSRLSIEEQHRQIKAFCTAQGLDLGANDARLGEESQSAYKFRFDDRPLGGQLNRNMVRGDHIVIAKLDRAFRDMIDAVQTVESWHQRGIVVHILDLPSGGVPIFDRLILGILAWCAEFESHRKSERMVEAFRRARRRGKPMRHCAPLGFRWVGNRGNGTHKLVYFPQEREHMQLCYELWLEHQLSLWEIASYLMSHRVKPYDKRAPASLASSKVKVSQEYHPSRITVVIRTEAEFRFYEAQGRLPEEAAEEWLRNWALETLPSEAALQEFLKSSALNNSQKPQKKGATVCETQTNN